MTGVDGFGTEPTFAVARRQPVNRGRARRAVKASYPPAEVLAAMKRWAAQYGEPPTMVDWDPSRARRLGQAWRAERFESGEWPTARVVCGLFAGFNAAVEQAGLKPRPAPSRQATNLVGPDAVLKAFVEWTRRHGDVPTMADWDPARARRLGQDWRIARYHQGDWPSARTVAHHFGSFAAAAAAAGLIPRRVGKHHTDRSAERAVNRLVVAQLGASDRDPGIEDLSRSLRTLAAARRRRDPVSTHAALIDLAGCALAWAQILDA